jgi:hypothetical protein
MFTGWWADITQKGQGIAKIDLTLSIEGEWGKINNFPNGGRDFIQTNNVDEYTVTNLYYREKSSSTANSDIELNFSDPEQSDEEFYEQIYEQFGASI